MTGEPITDQFLEIVRDPHTARILEAAKNPVLEYYTRNLIAGVGDTALQLQERDQVRDIIAREYGFDDADMLMVQQACSAEVVDRYGLEARLR